MKAALFIACKAKPQPTGATFEGKEALWGRIGGGAEGNQAQAVGSGG